MVENIIVTNNRLFPVLSNNKEILAEKVEGGLLLMPFVEEANWLSVFIQEREDQICLTIDKPDDGKPLYERIKEGADGEELEIWELSQEMVLRLCERDDQAIFKIARLLDMFKPDPDQLLTVLEVLTQRYSTERVFEDLFALSKGRARRLFKAQNTREIIEMYRRALK